MTIEITNSNNLPKDDLLLRPSIKFFRTLETTDWWNQRFQ